MFKNKIPAVNIGLYLNKENHEFSFPTWETNVKHYFLLHQTQTSLAKSTTKVTEGRRDTLVESKWNVNMGFQSRDPTQVRAKEFTHNRGQRTRQLHQAAQTLSLPPRSSQTIGEEGHQKWDTQNVVCAVEQREDSLVRLETHLSL